MPSSISKLAQKLQTKIWQKFKSILPTLPEYNKVVVEEINKNKIITIEKDNIKIVIGEDIEIIDKNKTTTVTGNIIFKSENGKITFESLGSGNWRPNFITHCLFTGTIHGGAPTITNLEGSG